ncbi:MAG: sigma 54-interacting transcriptional regulator [Phycisphaerae bacterium]|nr:sigma 54-interacting transcriptional regulator [Phycisphaerae bacterium]
MREDGSEFLLAVRRVVESGDVSTAAVPLSIKSGYPAILVLSSDSRRIDRAVVATLAEALSAPFSALLENDRRLRELESLREAAEADRRTLLSRLGRREIGDHVIGADTGLANVLSRVDIVAGSDVPVLILGETGTGKELVSRAIHTRSPRHAGPFIRVNCGAIPHELIDSQLFGHERGSFTGAVDTHRGWFERADHGTLFLDEIGELPPAAQVRLLRVMQDGLVERVGGRKTIAVDVRVVAATHRDLHAMVKAGQFREDLWYRIAVFPIHIPPLRERREDIASLACHFAERAATRFGLALVMPSPEDIRQLMRYAWPGNVRELGTVIDRAALLGNGKRLEIALSLGGHTSSEPIQSSLPSEEAIAPNASPISHEAMAEFTPAVNPDATSNEPVSAIEPLNDAIRHHIESALEKTLGRVEGPFGAARLLRINPRTLRSKMRKLKIDWRTFRQSEA